MTETDEKLGFWHLAERYPERISIVDTDGTETTFSELLDLVQRLSQALHDLGLVRSDAIACGLPNCRDFMLVELAAMYSGLYFVPVNCHLAPSEAAHVIADSESAVLVAHERFADFAVSAAEHAGLQAGRCFSVGSIPGFIEFSDLLAVRPAQPLPRIAGARMMYTSGTTGLPKGVRKALQNVDPVVQAAQIGRITARGFGNEPGEGVCLTCGPLHHAGPHMMSSTTLNVGYTQVLMDKWDAEECLAMIEKYQVTSAQMVPTMFHRLLALPEDVRSKYDVSSLRSIVHTAAPCPQVIKRKMFDWWGPVIYETYGGTEGAATIATPRSWMRKPGTVGKAIRGVDLKILDEDGNELPIGEIGDVYFRSVNGQPRTEYYKDPEKTRALWRGDYLTLGDMGCVDEDGFLFLRDRRKDMIISGGVNIYPAEAEAVLLNHPAVGDVAVIGVPDEEWGEQVKAVVEAAADREGTPELAAELIDFCRAELAHFKCPRSVDFRDELPRAENGKLYKRQVREEYWREAGIQI